MLLVVVVTGLLCPSQGVVQLGITLSEETEDHIQVRRREVGEIGKLNCHLLYTTTVAVLSVIIALSLPSPHIYHTHTHTHSLAHNHTHSHTHVLSHTHTHTHSPTYTQAAAAWALGRLVATPPSMPRLWHRPTCYLASCSCTWAQEAQRTCRLR